MAAMFGLALPGHAGHLGLGAELGLEQQPGGWEDMHRLGGLDPDRHTLGFTWHCGDKQRYCYPILLDTRPPVLDLLYYTRPAVLDLLY